MQMSVNMWRVVSAICHTQQRVPEKIALLSIRPDVRFLVVDSLGGLNGVSVAGNTRNIRFYGVSSAIKTGV